MEQVGRCRPRVNRGRKSRQGKAEGIAGRGSIDRSRVGKGGDAAGTGLEILVLAQAISVP